MEMALQWCSDAYADTLVGFANSIRTADGGTHLDGMRAALTRTVNALGEREGQRHEGRQTRGHPAPRVCLIVINGFGRSFLSLSLSFSLCR